MGRKTAKRLRHRARQEQEAREKGPRNREDEAESGEQQEQD